MANFNTKIDSTTLSKYILKKTRWRKTIRLNFPLKESLGFWAFLGSFSVQKCIPYVSHTSFKRIWLRDAWPLWVLSVTLGHVIYIQKLLSWGSTSLLVNVFCLKLQEKNKVADIVMQCWRWLMNSTSSKRSILQWLPNM